MKTATQAQRGPYQQHFRRESSIHRLRRNEGLTQVQAAGRAGVSLRTYQRAEAGDVVPPSVKRKIERSLGVAW